MASLKVLLLGGGTSGAGGDPNYGDSGGNGGAGGEGGTFVYNASIPILTGSYTVTVGGAGSNVATSLGALLSAPAGGGVTGGSGGGGGGRHGDGTYGNDGSYVGDSSWGYNETFSGGGGGGGGGGGSPEGNGGPGGIAYGGGATAGSNGSAGGEAGGNFWDDGGPGGTGGAGGAGFAKIGYLTGTMTGTGGNSVYIEGSYTVHLFTSSGTFTATLNTATINTLVVGGGGGGGRTGGGGAGGLVYTAGMTILTNSYTVTVGGGGSGSEVNSAGGQGGNSVFNGITAIGGGGGGQSNGNGNSGGSGGGGSGTFQAGTKNGGAGTAGQGYAGGLGTADIEGNWAGGGGGGAGAVGSAGTTDFNNAYGGNGGIGAQNSISGTATYYAGGGGGAGSFYGGYNGTGGLGGGGTPSAGYGNNGTDGLGGGGGGNGVGGRGGSGVVIISYTTGAMFAVGGTVTYAGGKTIHTFTSSGTFTATIGIVTESLFSAALVLNETSTPGLITNVGGITYDLAQTIQGRTDKPMGKYEHTTSKYIRTSTAQTLDNRILHLWLYKGTHPNGGAHTFLSSYTQSDFVAHFDDTNNRLNILFNDGYYYYTVNVAASIPNNSLHHVVFAYYNVSGTTWNVSVFLDNVKISTQSVTGRTQTAGARTLFLRTSASDSYGSWTGGISDLSLFDYSPASPLSVNTLEAIVDKLYNNNWK